MALKENNTSGFDVGNVDAFMDGDLDGFIEEYLRQNS